MERYKYYRLNVKEKELVIRRIKAILEKEDVRLAILFGSFIELDAFRDVDVAVYLRSVELNHLLKLANRLEEELEFPVDVVPLNVIPSKFRHHILVKGRIILENQPGLYEALLIQTLDEITLLKSEIHKDSAGEQWNN